MKRIKLNAACAALLVGLAVSGCGDSGTAPADGLKPREAEALFDALVGLAFLGFGEPGSPVPGPGTATHQCRLGGEAVVSVEIDIADQRLGAAVDPMACGVSSGGWEFKLQGNPDYMLALAFITEDFVEFQIEGSMTGVVDWELDDRSGTCMIDMVLSGGVVQNFADPQGFGAATGTMCGLEVEFDG